MENLTVLIFILFLFVISIGPLSYGISLLPFLPKWLKYTFAVISVLAGICWLTLPNHHSNMLCIIPVYLGFVSFAKQD